MKKFLILIIPFIIFSCSKNEEKKILNKTNTDTDSIYVTVEQPPFPIGGMVSIIKNVYYPEESKKAGIQGKVFVKAFIDTLGNVFKTELLKKVDPNLDTAAENAVSRTKFSPAVHKGKHVKVQVAIPIVFKLK